MANPKVDAYIARSQMWREELEAVRPILLDSGLTEEIKWGKPCYSHDGSNIVILQEMKNFLALMFFNGAVLRDPQGVLDKQGPNSHAARRITFTAVADVQRLADTIASYLDEATAAQTAGLTVAPAPPVTFVAELQARLDHDDAFRAAFEALTPGRRREYNMHFADAKQSATRKARIDKYADKIKSGKGFRDR
jgi:uncharacterized protein YdeI (YjbR/CyaY-like superfamily)